jgi:hypothetical protein
VAAALALVEITVPETAQKRHSPPQRVRVGFGVIPAPEVV